jgi:hypothetical protein
MLSARSLPVLGADSRAKSAAGPHCNGANTTTPIEPTVPSATNHPHRKSSSHCRKGRDLFPEKLDRLRLEYSTYVPGLMSRKIDEAVDARVG